MTQCHNRWTAPMLISFTSHSNQAYLSEIAREEIPAKNSHVMLPLDLVIITTRVHNDYIRVSAKRGPVAAQDVHRRYWQSLNL